MRNISIPHIHRTPWIRDPVDPDRIYDGNGNPLATIHPKTPYGYFPQTRAYVEAAPCAIDALRAARRVVAEVCEIRKNFVDCKPDPSAYPQFVLSRIDEALRMADVKEE